MKRNLFKLLTMTINGFFYVKTIDRKSEKAFKNDSAIAIAKC